MSDSGGGKSRSTDPNPYFFTVFCYLSEEYCTGCVVRNCKLE